MSRLLVQSRVFAPMGLLFLAWGCLESNPQPSPLTDVGENNQADSSAPDMTADDDGMYLTDVAQKDTLVEEDITGGGCDTVECSGHGTCQVVAGQPLCVCDPGWMNADDLTCVPLPLGHWCDLLGWCFQEPHIPPYTLNTLYVPKAGEIWAMGEWGTVLHGNGVEGTVERLPDFNALKMIGFGTQFMLATGQGGQWSVWDGASWATSQIEGAGDLALLTGPSKDDLWTAWGALTSDPWSPQYVTHILHWDGKGWTEVKAPGNGFSATALQSGNDGSVFLGGHFSHLVSDTQPNQNQAALFRWQDEKWTAVAGLAKQDAQLAALEVVSAQEIFVVYTDSPAQFTQDPPQSQLYRWDGDTLTQLSDLGEAVVRDLYSPEAGQVWGVTFSGSAFHWKDGTVQTYVLPGVPSLGLNAMTGLGGNDIWVAGNGGQLFHWDGQNWTGFQSGATPFEMAALTGTSGDDVWAVGGFQQAGIQSFSQSMHWDGQVWQQVEMSGPAQLAAACAVSPDDVWAVGADMQNNQGLVGHWDGDTWTFDHIADTGYLSGVWAYDEQVVWAVGTGAYGPQGLSKAAIWRRAEGTWTKNLEIPDTMLMGTRGLDTNDVWAWGTRDGEATAFRWQGDTWMEISLGVTGVVLDIEGSQPADLWALVYWCTPENVCGGRVLRWDGLSWTQVWEALDGPVTAMVVRNNQDVTVLGVANGYHWNGSTWTPFTQIWPSLSDAAFFGDSMWAVGSLAVIRRHSTAAPNSALR